MTKCPLIVYQQELFYTFSLNRMYVLYSNFFCIRKVYGKQQKGKSEQFFFFNPQVNFNEVLVHLGYLKTANSQVSSTEDLQ